MPCFKPLTGWYGKFRNKDTGKKPIVFNKKDSDGLSSISLPCGRCIGCRLERSRQWAIRCTHESKMYEENIFITLTYDDENMPYKKSLVKEDFQNFMKRLRKKYISYYDKGNLIRKRYPVGHKIRYFQCGEYGSKTHRPHYHAILFNFSFEDQKPCIESRDTNQYSSKSLDELWPFGLTSIGEVNFESAAYVARYQLEKIQSDGSVSKNRLLSKGDRYSDGRLKEYLTMSKGRYNVDGIGAIGRSFLEKYKDTDIYNFDTIIVRNGIKCKPPKYYDKVLEKDDPVRLHNLKIERSLKASKNPHNRGQRLFQRGRVAFLKQKQKKRNKL